METWTGSATLCDNQKEANSLHRTKETVRRALLRNSTQLLNTFHKTTQNSAWATSEPEVDLYEYKESEHRL